MKRALAILLAVSLLPAAGAAQPKDGPAANPAAQGIPPEVAQRLGISKELSHQIDDAVFEANRSLIDLEAAHRKAQLDLDRELRSPTPDDAKVMQLVTSASQTELGVRKNRLGLLLKVRRLLGPDTWERVRAEMGAQSPGKAPSPAPPPSQGAPKR
jgi:hypothetical protein